jgi:hypothetical protein
MIHILLIILFILTITCMVCMSCSTTVVPFIQDTIFPRHSEVEGYSNIQTPTISDSNNKYLINKPETECDKIFGFNGLLCNKRETDSRLDAFSDAVGNPSCEQTSGGLSNSKGPLCLSPAHIKLLSTRGGNITKCDSEIAP